MKRILILCVLFSLFFSYFTLGQELSEKVSQRREDLEKELAALDNQISQTELLIFEKQKEATTFERDIAIIDAQISKMRLEIRSLELLIEKLSAQIFEKEDSIENIVGVISKERMSLAAALRKLREYDDMSLLEIVLSHEKLSDFFGDIDAIDVVQSSLQESFYKLRSTKETEEKLRDDFINKKNQEMESKALLAIEKRSLENKEAERQHLLDITRGQESIYQGIVSAKKKDAASIRSQLFLLEGSPAIPFEQAVLFAERASAKTGVREAFILGIIAQESELGRNIGQCNLPDDPPKYKWQAIMKPSRDHEPYLAITSDLGLDPNLMPLSCPMSVGWGGAMGPAQFIPSTWVLFDDRIAKATGHNPPNPWEPEDAFMASAIFLSDLGADTRAGEYEAAGRYFAGSRWNTSLGKRYASQVLAKVAIYQEQINILNGLALR
ncbi:lytic murein transglycosylase [Patescibacteria group bacterium]